MLKFLLSILALIQAVSICAVDITDAPKPYIFNFKDKVFLKITLTYTSEKPLTIVLKAENSPYDNYAIKTFPPAKDPVTAVYETSISPQKNIPTAFYMRSSGKYSIVSCKIDETAQDKYTPDTVKPNPLRANNPRHIQIKKEVATAKNYILLCGDSLTDNWRGQDSYTYMKKNFNAINAGFCGDRIEDLLWRLEDMKDELKNNPPALFVFMIGTNNIGLGSSQDDIVKGMENLINFVRKNTPAVKSVVFAIPPRSLPYLKKPVPMVGKINAGYEKICDGENAYFFDFSKSLVTKDGILDPELYASDCLHFSTKGYTNVITKYYAGAIDLVRAKTLPRRFMHNMKHWKEYLENRRSAANENNALEEFLACETHLNAIDDHYKKIFAALENERALNSYEGLTVIDCYVPKLPDELLRQNREEGIPQSAGIKP